MKNCVSTKINLPIDIFLFQFTRKSLDYELLNFQVLVSNTIFISFEKAFNKKVSKFESANLLEKIKFIYKICFLIRKVRKQFSFLYLESTILQLRLKNIFPPTFLKKMFIPFHAIVCFLKPELLPLVECCNVASFHCYILFSF